jgi:hypothetical protein
MHLYNFSKKINKRSILNLRNIINKNIITFILMFLIILAFIQEFNIFRNIFYLIDKNYNERAITAYEKTFFSGYCEKSSHGYLFYIKNKYSNHFNKNEIPKIINNFNGRNAYWIFYNINKKVSETQIIILNKKNDINLQKYRIIDEYKNTCFFIEKKND